MTSRAQRRLNDVSFGSEGRALQRGLAPRPGTLRMRHLQWALAAALKRPVESVHRDLPALAGMPLILAREIAGGCSFSPALWVLFGGRRLSQSQTVPSLGLVVSLFPLPAHSYLHPCYHLPV